MNARGLFVFGLLSYGSWGLAMTANAATRIDLNRDWTLVLPGLQVAPLLLAGAGKMLRPDRSISVERSLASQ